MPNWELISTPPSSLDEFVISVAEVQCQYYLGFIDASMFYGMLNVFFDLAWFDANPSHSGRAI